MKYKISSLYSSLPDGLVGKFHYAVEKGLEAGSGTASLFFRADDIGVPSTAFFQMIELFKKYDCPICLAVVPTWLTKARATALLQSANSKEIFCWHQHGWRHTNNAFTGKKQEFGDDRSLQEITTDLKNGKTRLENLLGERFFPFFTPPWNRCGTSALLALEDLHFSGISRSKGAQPLPAGNFPDIQVNVDLHTRKETNPEESLNNLLEELRVSVETGSTGVMLHHQRMNSHSFILLEQLLQTLTKFETIIPGTFADLV